MPVELSTHVQRFAEDPRWESNAAQRAGLAAEIQNVAFRNGKTLGGMVLLLRDPEATDISTEMRSRLLTTITDPNKVRTAFSNEQASAPTHEDIVALGDIADDETYSPLIQAALEGIALQPGRLIRSAKPDAWKEGVRRAANLLLHMKPSFETMPDTRREQFSSLWIGALARPDLAAGVKERFKRDQGELPTREEWSDILCLATTPYNDIVSEIMMGIGEQPETLFNRGRNQASLRNASDRAVAIAENYLQAMPTSEPANRSQIGRRLSLFDNYLYLNETDRFSYRDFLAFAEFFGGEADSRKSVGATTLIDALSRLTRPEVSYPHEITNTTISNLKKLAEVWKDPNVPIEGRRVALRTKIRAIESMVIAPATQLGRSRRPTSNYYFVTPENEALADQAIYLTLVRYKEQLESFGDTQDGTTYQARVFAFPGNTHAIGYFQPEAPGQSEETFRQYMGTQLHSFLDRPAADSTQNQLTEEELRTVVELLHPPTIDPIKTSELSDLQFWTRVGSHGLHAQGTRIILRHPEEATLRAMGLRELRLHPLKKGISGDVRITVGPWGNQTIPFLLDTTYAIRGLEDYPEETRQWLHTLALTYLLDFRQPEAAGLRALKPNKTQGSEEFVELTEAETKARMAQLPHLRVNTLGEFPGAFDDEYVAEEMNGTSLIVVNHAFNDLQRGYRQLQDFDPGIRAILADYIGRVQGIFLKEGIGTQTRIALNSVVLGHLGIDEIEDESLREDVGGILQKMDRRPELPFFPSITYGTEGRVPMVFRTPPQGYTLERQGLDQYLYWVTFVRAPKTKSKDPFIASCPRAAKQFALLHATH